MTEILILFIVVLIGGAVVRHYRRRQATITTDLGRPLSGGQTPASSPPKTYVLKAPPPSKPKHMDQPVERLFTFRDEYDAASARQRVWVRYKDMRGNETDRKIEIYYPQDDEYVFAWCCLKNEPRTFSRRKIQAWQLLDEQFQFDPLIERYWLLTKLKTAEAPQTIRRPMGKKP